MYILKKEFHSDVYYIALVLLAMSLPLSKFSMSVMQFSLLFLWFWSGFSFLTVKEIFTQNNTFKSLYLFLEYVFKLPVYNFINKFQQFFRNRAAVVVASVFVLHLFGLIYTSDFSYALKDLRIKLPLLMLPVVISTMQPIGKKRFHALMLFFVGAVIIGTFFGISKLIQQDFTDIRKISIFISPIRFSLNICIAIFTLIYFIGIRNNYTLAVKFMFIVMVIWLISFLILLESGIGLIIIISVAFLLGIYLVFTIKNLWVRSGILIAVVLIPTMLFMYVRNIVLEYKNAPDIEVSQLDERTIYGEKYIHDIVRFPVEGGKYTGLYIAWKELERSWNDRSPYDFKGSDDCGQHLRYTLIRYMTSKDLRKDAEGVFSLTEKDIRNIERGIANINYIQNPSIKTRIWKFLVGYESLIKFDDPNGNSITQRLEHWKAAYRIIKKNFWLGVGTGDTQEAFASEYDEMNTKLDIENRWRSHNQFMSIFVALGVFGFLYFIFCLVYPPLILNKFNDYFYVIFFFVLIMSMITEDTLETQAGVTLFAFFNAFLLFGRKSK